VEKGVIVNRCNRDSYLVRNENGRLIKRRHHELKGLISVRLRLEEDVIKGEAFRGEQCRRSIKTTHYVLKIALRLEGKNLQCSRLLRDDFH
jgi:hypothetical protein